MKLLIIDENPIEVEGLRLLLRHQCNDIRMSNWQDGIREAKKIDPEVILLDTSRVGDPSAFSIQLKKTLPTAKVLWLLEHKSPERDDETQLRALIGMANGCIFKSEIGQIVKSLRVVSGDEFYFPRSLMAKWLRSTVALAGADLKTETLTAREKQICQLAHFGRTNQEIAAEIGLSEQTVKIHLRHIRRKLNIKSKRQLAYCAGVPE